MDRAWRTAGILLALAALAVLSACDPGPFEDDATRPGAVGPEIDLWINGGGGDSIEVYLEGSASDRREIAEGVAAWLGFSGAIAHDDGFYPDTSTVETTSRFISPAGEDAWTLDLDATGLARVLVSTGYQSGVLSICTPQVETRLRATPPPDLGLFDTVCDLNGRGWSIRTFDADQPRIRLTLLADPADYLAYAAGVLLATVLLGALAWWIGDKLRRGPFARRSGAAVAIGLVGGGLAAIGLAALTSAVGASAGPADNLALARDLTAGGYGSSLLFPALIAAAPGIVFSSMLVRRRPWDEPVPRGAAPPQPPAAPGPPGPPPLPWG